MTAIIHQSKLGSSHSITLRQSVTKNHGTNIFKTLTKFYINRYPTSMSYGNGLNQIYVTDSDG